MHKTIITDRFANPWAVSARLCSPQSLHELRAPICLVNVCNWAIASAASQAMSATLISKVNTCFPACWAATALRSRSTLSGSLHFGYLAWGFMSNPLHDCTEYRLFYGCYASVLAQFLALFIAESPAIMGPMHAGSMVPIIARVHCGRCSFDSSD